MSLKVSYQRYHIKSDDDFCSKSAMFLIENVAIQFNWELNWVGNMIIYKVIRTRKRLCGIQNLRFTLCSTIEKWNAFRGQYHYLFITLKPPIHSYILLILCTFYQLLYVIYTWEYKYIAHTVHVSESFRICVLLLLYFHYACYILIILKMC